MPVLKTYNIFICHAWSQDFEYNSIVEGLTNSPLFLWRNCSNPDPELDGDPRVVANQNALSIRLASQIKSCHCVLVLAGMFNENKEWLTIQLELARRVKKPIIAIQPIDRGQVPAELKSVCKKVSDWEIPQLIRTIRRYSH